jgi:hypothetical protein
LLANGRWFSPGTPAFSTTKTGRHDIAEILLKVALSTKHQIITMSAVAKIHGSKDNMRNKTMYHIIRFRHVWFNDQMS